MMLPGDDETVVTSRATAQKERWYKPIRCSICTSYIWFRPIAFKEPPGAPEPRHEWVLCKPCRDGLLLELRRSRISSPLRLRIAMGFVAADRSPDAYGTYTIREQREFAWAVRFLIFFTLWHLLLLAILFAAPK